MRKASPKPPPRKPPGNLWIYAGLLAATVAVYAQAGRFAFVNFDDPDYVTRNVHVRDGITGRGLAWAWTSGEAANWFPLTRLSHMLDCQLFGLDSGWHHLVNVWWHACAALLLFAFLHRATQARWRSAFVAMVFALHPLHVESVAWVAERKDVLSTFFWFLTLWAYVRYVERPSWRRYAAVLGAFALGLLSKPMIVTLPLVLMLLDVWPLGRPRSAAIWHEKIPLLAMSAAVSVVTFVVQERSGAVEAVALFPLGLRLENAIVSCAVYVWKTLAPTGLAVFYPYPSALPVLGVLAAGLVLAGVTAGVWRGFRSRPYLAVGWFWFLITLAPVIGLVQVGAQARADRYTYVPMVGLTIVLGWGAAEVFGRAPKAAAGLAAAAGVGCAGLAWAQAGYWEDSVTLFRHAIAVTQGNYLAEHNLGVALAENPGGLPEAIEHYRAALEIRPDYARAHTDLGSALARSGRYSEAVEEYRAALQLLPDSAIPHSNLGNALAQMPGKLGDAIAEYQTALRLDPDYEEARLNLGIALGRMPGRSAEAAGQLQSVLRADPESAAAHAALGSALADLPGRLPEAVQQYETALRIAPENAEIHYNLGLALLKADRWADAVGHLETAVRLRPDYAEAHNDLGVALSQAPNRLGEAIGHFEAALKIRPDFGDAHYNLGVALSNLPGRGGEALSHLEAALRIHPDPELRKAVERLRAGQRN